MKQRLILLIESFEEIAEDVRSSLELWNEGMIKFHFLRASRCLQKIESFFEGAQEEQERSQGLRAWQSCRNQMAGWHHKLADRLVQSGRSQEAERELEASLSFSSDDPAIHMKLAHLTLANCSLLVDKSIEDNMRYFAKTNLYEAIAAIRRARFSMQAYASIIGPDDPYLHMMGWLDQMEIKLSELYPVDFGIMENQRTMEQIRSEIASLIGLASVKQKMSEISNWIVFDRMRREQGYKQEPISLHMVFSGNPGTGKTTVARLLAELFRALGVLKKGHIVEVDRSQLVAEYVGQTAVKTSERIKEAIGGVLFIDEAYALTRSDGNDFGIEAVDTIVKAMEDKRGEFVVVLAGYPAEMKHFLKSNPGLHSRFNNQIHFPDYTIPELMQISDALLQKKQFRMTDGAKVIFRRLLKDQVIKNPERHGNGRLVRNLLEEAILDKASYVVQQSDSKISNLDVIDETIIKAVEQDMMQAPIHTSMLSREY